jgi:hypothetical protein
MLEDFIRESRMVMLGFFIEDQRIKQRANDIIENKVAVAATEAGGNTSINALRAKTVDAYYDMGTRYFKRYAIMNWTIFLTPRSQQRLENIKSEIAVIDEVIYQVQHQTRYNDRKAMMELGQYLFSKVRLERLLDNAEMEMINLIESPIFRERLLPDVVRYFYNASRRRS